MVRKNEFAQKVDTLVGQRLQELRMSLGLSRHQLASKIDVTHQQLQKYERGTNRITIGRLVLIAKALKRPISYFIDEIEHPVPDKHQRMCIEASRNFAKVANPAHQEAINYLLKTLATN